MLISKEEAKRVMKKVREARAEYFQVANGHDCDKAKLIYLALDTALMMVADETTQDYLDPDLLVSIGNIIESLELWKKIIVRRQRQHPETAELFRG
jgi:hypothetical protein